MSQLTPSFDQTLANLRDIHLPPIEPFFPATVGWYLMGLVLLAVIFWLWHFWRWRLLRRQLRVIAQLPAQQQPDAIIKLLKYYCIQYQASTTRLQGEAWINWLQQALNEDLSDAWRQWILYGHLQQQAAPVDWQASLCRWLKRLPVTTSKQSIQH